MAKLELSGIKKSFGATEVLKGIDLTVDDGEFVAFVGPSGCGKSTLLRLICGLDEITAGQMAIDGQIVNVNADWAANELIKTLQPYKIVFLTGTGGLLDAQGEVIDSINLSTEYDHLIAQPWINGGMRVKLEQIKDLLDKLPLSSSVSM